MYRRVKDGIDRKNYTTQRLERSNYYKEVKEFLNILASIEEYDEDLDPRITDLRDIFNETIIPYSVYQENKDTIEDLVAKYSKTLGIKATNAIREERAILRDKLYEFTVDIPQYRVTNARKLNREEQFLKIGSYESIKVIDYEYDSTFGLKYSNDKKLFSNSQIL